MSRIDDLVAELAAEHEAFHAALDAVDLELVTVPGVVEDWSVRDLVVHVAFWAEHAAQAMALAVEGRGGEFAYDTADTDAMNARLLEEARQTTPEAAVEREERAFEGFIAAVRSLGTASATALGQGSATALDPASETALGPASESVLLDLRLGNGDTVAEVIDYDGAAHYREHTAHLRAWFGDDDDEGDEEDDKG